MKSVLIVEKMPFDIHAIMQHTPDVDNVFADYIENPMPLNAETPIPGSHMAEVQA